MNGLSSELVATLAAVFTKRQLLALFEKQQNLYSLLKQSWEKKERLDDVSISNPLHLLKLSLEDEEIEKTTIPDNINSGNYSFVDLWDFLITTPDQPSILQLHAADSLLGMLCCSDPGKRLAISIGEEITRVFMTLELDITGARLLIRLAHIVGSIRSTTEMNNREQALEVIRKVESVITREQYPRDWAELHYILGSILSSGTIGDTAENLENVIKSYLNALEIYTRGDYPARWAVTSNALGIAYCFRIHGSRSENVENAILYCSQALTMITAEADPELWSNCHNNLGISYEKRVCGNRAENLEQAIEHYGLSLEILSRDNDTEEWARVHINQSNLFQLRIRGDRAENIEKAIQHLQDALEVTKKDGFALNWATLQVDLGLAYSYRIKGRKNQNLLVAIEHYENAFDIIIRDSFHDIWAAIAINYGVAWLLLEDDNRTENVEKAIRYFNKVLDIHTIDNNPERWALLQFNLGEAYYKRIAGEKESNLDRAENYLTQSLTINTREDLPVHWAMSQHQLGCVFFDRLKGDPVENLNQAIVHFQNALEILTHDAFPNDHLIICKLLGEAYLQQGKLDEALLSFQQGLTSFETLYRHAITSDSLQDILKRGSPTYFLTAYCHALQGELEKTALITSRGKARALSDRMILDRVILKKLTEKDRSLYRNLIDHMTDLEGELQNQTSEGRSYTDISEELTIFRRKLDRHIDHIRNQHPGFLHPEIALRDITSLFPDQQTAFIEFCITEYGSSITVLLGGAFEQLGWIDIVHDFAKKDLDTLHKMWLHNYSELKTRQNDESRYTSWIKKTRSLLNGFYEAVFKKTEQKLYERGVKRLIFSPHRTLHIIPLHLMCKKKNGLYRYLLEDYEISYTPNIVVLYHSMKKQSATHPTSNTSISAIANPTKDLIFAEEEVSAITRFFDQSRVLVRENAQLPDAMSCLDQGDYLHLACHCRFIIDNPNQSGLLLTSDQPHVPGLFEDEQEKTEKAVSCVNRPITSENTTPSGEKSEDNKPLNSNTKRSISFKMSKKVPHSRILSLFDIYYRLKLDNTRLVVLSACESGLVDVRGEADEYVGLPAAFLHSGAGAVISSLWLVDDKATKELMVHFYHNHLHDNMTPSAALRSAQLTMLNQGRNPFYWGAFILTGV